MTTRSSDDLAKMEEYLRDTAAAILDPDSPQSSGCSGDAFARRLRVLDAIIAELNMLTTEHPVQAARLLELALGVRVLADGTDHLREKLAGIRSKLAMAEAARSWLR